MGCAISRLGSCFCDSKSSGGPPQNQASNRSNYLQEKRAELPSNDRHETPGHDVPGRVDINEQHHTATLGDGKNTKESGSHHLQMTAGGTQHEVAESPTTTPRQSYEHEVVPLILELCARLYAFAGRFLTQDGGVDCSEGPAKLFRRVIEGEEDAEDDSSTCALQRRDLLGRRKTDAWCDVQIQVLQSG
jgi:hypothetical protein